MINVLIKLGKVWLIVMAVLLVTGGTAALFGMFHPVAGVLAGFVTIIGLIIGLVCFMDEIEL